MRLQTGRGPPPRSDAEGGPQERLGKRLDNDFTPRPRPAQSVPRERLAHLARQIHRLGERALAELFIELDAGGELVPVLERYAQLAPLADFIRALGGDRLPIARPLHGSGGRDVA